MNLKRNDNVKHKFKREKRWQYLVISKCVRCGLQREKREDRYIYDPFGKKINEETECTAVMAKGID